MAQEVKVTALEDWGIFDNESQALSSKKSLKESKKEEEEEEKKSKSKNKGKK